MRKLRLNLDALRVDTFDTAEPRTAPDGTVAAHVATFKCNTRFCTNQCAPTQCTCGIDPRAAEAADATYCNCCV